MLSMASSTKRRSSSREVSGRSKTCAPPVLVPSSQFETGLKFAVAVRRITKCPPGSGVAAAVEVVAVL